jgi:AcrR family transcriptional regulator
MPKNERSRAAAPPRKPSPARRSRRPLRRTRKVDPATRRQTILDAALSVFAERGFGAARLDDVAACAGVAKGTLYLYFKDKEQLFEEVIRGAVSPILERLDALAAAPDLPFEMALEALAVMFEREVLGTRRKLLVRLMITEGPRFPRIAEFHYRTVVSRIMPLIRTLAERAIARGEIASDALVRYPQLLAAPLLFAVIWDALFAKIAPLDVAGFFRAHRQLLLAAKTMRASQ